MTSDDEILAELKKIREAVEKGPPPTPPKGLWNEFKEFLKSYKVLGLAVAFVLGLYLGALVQSVVKDFIIPLLGLAIPGLTNLATYMTSVGKQSFGIGDFSSGADHFHYSGTNSVPNSENRQKNENRLNSKSIFPLLFLKINGAQIF